MVQKPESDIEPKERRIDLSLPQVAGSAVAAVAAAVAASQLGVYGTILGAGVMSVVATCGGSLFQHFFRRTGEQIREVTVQAKQPGREVTVQTRGASDPHAVYGVRRPPAGMPDGAMDATTMMRAVDAATMRGGTDATTVLRKVADDPDRTRLLRPLDGTRSLDPVRPEPDEEFSEATTHGTRIRGWKRSALGAAVVFAVTMAGITTFELVSGNGLSGGQGTTVGSVVRGERGAGSHDPAPATGTDPGPGQERSPDQESGATPGTDSQGGQSRSPDSGQGDRSPADPTPSPTPSGNTGQTNPSPAATPSPVVPGDGGTAAPNPTGAGDAPLQGDRATTGTGTGQ
ncbi:hypothetical protein OG306_29115 [Streptomyces sp. NBC_01241]|uniref:hypothetical protein n=1 Tax=Streptomyces sp. NBC_01241 TaxID=2903794 RepID=UPI00352E0631|nr:hypothetical protein OG306_29115 [Streptomyces sp. NBC_01241]